nr:Ig-like domain-containing protein [Kosakonia sp. R1.Fl]
MVTFTADVNHLSPTLSTLAADPSSIDESGLSMSTLTLILKDIYGNLIAGQSIELISSMAELVHSGFTDRKNGSYDAMIGGVTRGDVTLSVKVNGKVLEGLSTTFHILPVAVPMPADTEFSVNGYEFSIGSHFPVTGILGAKFQFLFNGTASNNSGYQWSVDQPWVSIDSDANVTFIDTPDSTNNTVTVTALPIDTGTPRYVYTFTVSQWFVTAGGVQKNWADANAWCKENGLEMPSQNDLVYYEPEFDLPQRHWASYLWSEWGDCSRYANAGVTSNYYCWVTDVGDNGVHRNISLGDGSEYVNNSGVLTDATELYVVGKKAL